jgi:hypothetical protein
MVRRPRNPPDVDARRMPTCLLGSSVGSVVPSGPEGRYRLCRGCEPSAEPAPSTPRAWRADTGKVAAAPCRPSGPWLFSHFYPGLYRPGKGSADPSGLRKCDAPSQLHLCRHQCTPAIGKLNLGNTSEMSVNRPHDLQVGGVQRDNDLPSLPRV